MTFQPDDPRNRQIAAGPDCKVRSMCQRDLPVVSKLLSDEVQLCRPDGLSERLTEALARSGDTIFVAESRGDVVGVLVASYNGFHVFVSHIAVLPDWRGRGVGRMLHEAMLSRAKELGALGVIADSWLSAVPFFYRSGYRTPGAVFLIRDLR